MFKKNIKINERTYDLVIGDENGGLDVSINGKKYSFENHHDQQDQSQALGEVVSSNKTKSKQIKSPLSGMVAGVYVKARESVRKGQKLVTILAMKMENEIVSETDERIKEVRVNKDQIVNKNDILIVFDD